MERSSFSVRWRRERQRAAHRRRECAGRRAHGPVLLGRLADLDPGVRAAVVEFVDRAVAYPWVLGCFLERRGEGHRLILQVPRPMTRALGCLAESWLAEIRARRPGPLMDFEVSAREPRPGVRTVFRR